MDHRSFNISIPQMREALLKAGWNTRWTENNWIHPNALDHMNGYDLFEAFSILLKSKGILGGKNGT